MDFEKEVQLRQQSLSEKARENTQLVSDLRSSQKAAVDLESSANNMHSQLRQQAAMMTSFKKQNAEIFETEERDLQKRRQVEEQLETERRQNATFGEFFEALHIKTREDIVNLISGKIDLDPAAHE